MRRYDVVLGSVQGQLYLYPLHNEEPCNLYTSLNIIRVISTNWGDKKCLQNFGRTGTQFHVVQYKE